MSLSKIKSKKNKFNYSASSKHNEIIKVNCIVYGKSTAPYHIPKRIQIKCLSDDKFTCPLCSKKKDHIIELIPKNQDVLRFIDVHINSWPKIIKNVFNLIDKFSYKILEYQSVIRIFILPPTDNNRKRITGLTSTSYYIGDQLDMNAKYHMIGYTTTHPKDQTVTHIFTEAHKERTDIESFQMTDNMHKILSEFCRDYDKAEDIINYLEDLYTIYAYNITKILDRTDLHMAIDLVFRSPLQFRLGHEFVPKGWSDIMILGDSSCGKNYVARELSAYFNIGEMIGGENCTFAGLIGGLQQLGGRHWTITWGRIPLNDGGVLVIDEASELKHSDWTRLSRVRSEGIAEVTKINTQQTSARTRLIFLANPIEKTIANYSHGIQALPDLVKQSEDIRRFDYVLIVAHNDVDMDKVHKKLKNVEKKEPIYTPLMEQSLIQWTWSRKLDEIVFSEKAIDSIYTRASLLAKNYSFSIPLIQKENIRLKMAKLAICFAARMYSNKRNGKILYVEKVHVDCAIVFLKMIYGKSSCGYESLSKLNAKTEADFNKDHFNVIASILDSYMDKRIILEYLLKYDIITSKGLAEYTGRDITTAQEVISKLLQYDHIIPATEKSAQRYMKVSAFVIFIKIMLKFYERHKGFKEYQNYQEGQEENL